MSNLSTRSISSVNAEPIPSLSDRVAQRVMAARLAIESEANAQPAASKLDDTKTTAEHREIRSMKRVFRDMGYAYRRYRSQTGGPVAPGLRDAAYSFRANPSLPALLGVATILDGLDLLS